MILALLALAQADPAADLVRQRQIVDLAAAAVAEGRAEGLRRTELAARMAQYRAAAAALEQLESQIGPPAGDVEAERHAAVDALRAALAEGTSNPAARAAVVSWLGEPVQRLGVLGAAVDGVAGVPDGIRRGVLLDVLDQTDALAVCLAFDAATEDATRDQLQLRAASLRRRAPGQTPSMADEVEAVRAMEQAGVAEAHASELRALRDRVLTLRARAAAQLGEQP